MFDIHVDSVFRLRNALGPLVQVSNKADIKCSAEKLSIIVVPDDFPYVVALRMAPSFFTSFEFLDEDEELHQEYRSRFHLDLFVRNLFSVNRTSVSLTILLLEHQLLAPLQFEDSSTGDFQTSALVMSRPLNIDVGQIDYRIFVAIDSFAFMLIVSQLPGVLNGTVIVTLTESQVKFAVPIEEVVLTTENEECVIGGVPTGSQIQFLISLDPRFFFFHMAFLCNWVWLFKSISSRNLMSFSLELDASFVVSF